MKIRYENLDALLAANRDFKDLLGNNAVIAFNDDGSIVVIHDQRGQTTMQSPDCYLKAFTTGSPEGPQGYFVGTVNDTARRFMASIPKTSEFKAWRFGTPKGAIVDMNGKTSKVPCMGIENAFDDDMVPIAIEVTRQRGGTDVIEISDAFEAITQPAVAQPAVG